MKQKNDEKNVKLKEVGKVQATLANDIVSGVTFDEPISVSTAKTKFLECYRFAEKGFEVITQKRNSENVSILSTSVVSAMLDNIKFTIIETVDKELDNVVTVAVKEVPLYGEGKDREAAIDDLIESTLEFLDIYREQIDLYNKADSAERKIYMLKLLRCGVKKDAIRKAYGL